jgi:hypothetical protein
MEKIFYLFVVCLLTVSCVKTKKNEVLSVSYPFLGQSLIRLLN